MVFPGFDSPAPSKPVERQQVTKKEDGMTNIIIKGADLDYFKSVVQSAISGDLGELEEVRIVVNPEQQKVLTIGTNGYVSSEIGVNADNVCSECGQTKVAVTQ